MCFRVVRLKIESCKVFTYNVCLHYVLIFRQNGKKILSFFFFGKHLILKKKISATQFYVFWVEKESNLTNQDHEPGIQHYKWRNKYKHVHNQQTFKKLPFKKSPEVSFGCLEFCTHHKSHWKRLSGPINSCNGWRNQLPESLRELLIFTLWIKGKTWWIKCLSSSCFLCTWIYFSFYNS